MFDSTILNATTDLILIYVFLFSIHLFLSLICSCVHEFIATFMKLRAKTLEEGIRNLLYDKSGNDLAKKFYNHPLIKGLYSREKKRPSYIPSRTFALALMDIIMPVEGARPKNIEDIRKLIDANKNLNNQVKKTLLILIDEAGNNFDKGVSDFNKALNNIESWFNNSMERIAGWYRRKTQIIIYLIAIFFVFILNIDTLTLFKNILYKSAIYTTQVTTTQEPTKQSSSSNLNEIHLINIPLGWNTPFPDNKFSKYQKIEWWFAKCLGLMFSVFFISLGAGIWFDILNKIISLRTEKKPFYVSSSPTEIQSIPPL